MGTRPVPSLLTAETWSPPKVPVPLSRKPHLTGAWCRLPVCTSPLPSVFKFATSSTKPSDPPPRRTDTMSCPTCFTRSLCLALWGCAVVHPQGCGIRQIYSPVPLSHRC